MLPGASVFECAYLMTPLLLIVLAGFWIPGGAAANAKPRSAKFTNAGLNNKLMVNGGNIVLQVPAVNKLACSARCDRQATCLTFTFHQGTCTGYDKCATPSVTTTPAPGARTFVLWEFCVRNNGRPCHESGVTQTRIPSLGLEMDVSCDADWMVIQRRKDGSVDFYRNWQSYVTGFGNLQGEFWFGLSLLHQLTTAQQYDLRVDLKKWNGNTAYATYSNFSVGPASGKYKLRFSAYTGGTTGDSLGYHKDFPFSTWDADNDISGDNCAELRHGGFWYKKCNDCNLNGEYKPSSSAPNFDGVNWGTFGGFTNSLKFAQMKIRPAA